MLRGRRATSLSILNGLCKDEEDWQKLLQMHIKSQSLKNYDHDNYNNSYHLKAFDSLRHPRLKNIIIIIMNRGNKVSVACRSSSSSMHTDDNINNHCANILSRHYYNEEDSPIYYYYYLVIQEWESNTLQGCPLSQPQIILFFFQEFADLQ